MCATIGKEKVGCILWTEAEYHFVKHQESVSFSFDFCRLLRCRIWILHKVSDGYFLFCICWVHCNIQVSGINTTVFPFFSPNLVPLRCPIDFIFNLQQSQLLGLAVESTVKCSSCHNGYQRPLLFCSWVMWICDFHAQYQRAMTATHNYGRQLGLTPVIVVCSPSHYPSQKLSLEIEYKIKGAF